LYSNSLAGDREFYEIFKTKHINFEKKLIETDYILIRYITNNLERFNDNIVMIKRNIYVYHLMTVYIIITTFE
jgi:hypothetical protein